RCHVWEAATGRHVRTMTLPGFRPDHLALSPDGTTAALAGSSDYGVVRLVNLYRSEEILAFSSPDQLFSTLAFSPDGRVLVTGGHDGSVRMWEVITGKQIFQCASHAEPVSAVAFSPDGRTFASSGGCTETYASPETGPHEIRIWDAATGKAIETLPVKESSV